VSAYRYPYTRPACPSRPPAKVAPARRTDYAACAARGAVEGALRGTDLMQKPKKLYACLLCFFLLNAVPSYAATDAKPEQHALDQIRAYISAGWDSLTRSLTDCATVVDTKLSTASVLYFPADFRLPASVEQLQKQCKVQVQHLPAVIHHIGEMDPGRIGARRQDRSRKRHGGEFLF
jgi:hypothetical protein